ncbi:MAG TPA: hypothetical protein VGK87_13910 [Anaerolineae bacterium]
MQAEQLDTLLDRWIRSNAKDSGFEYHVQIKWWNSEIELANLTAANLTGWVIIDWQHRGRGLSAKHAVPANQPSGVAQMLGVLEADPMHVNLQIILAPAADWAEAYSTGSLAPDLLPVLDSGHAVVLRVDALREKNDWLVIQAHQPPDDEPLPGFIDQPV